jgi:hypothetical protein
VCASAHGTKAITGEVAQKTLRHLTAAGIASTEKSTEALFILEIAQSFGVAAAAVANQC